MEILTTERLLLRTWRERDFDALSGILGDPVTMSHWPQPHDAQGVRGWLQRSVQSMNQHGFARWCCERLSDQQVVGDVGIMRLEVDGAPVNDLGYIIHRDFWRQGYAFEACLGAIAWARAHGLDALVANMAADNLASVAVAEKLGMQRRKSFINPNNRNKLTHIYELGLI